MNHNKTVNVKSFSLERSEEVQELISNKPEWIVRYGIQCMLILILLLISFSLVVQYPDLTIAKMRVNSLNSPKAVLAKQSGKINKLKVEDGDNVSAGQILAFIESTANPDDVLKLSGILAGIHKSLKNENISKAELLPDLNLGEVQGSYQTFYQEYLLFVSTLKKGYYEEKKALLLKDIANIDKIRVQLIKQANTQSQEYRNAEEEFNAYKKLYQNKVISRSEYMAQENKFLASSYPTQQTKTAMLSNSDSYNAKQKELLDIEHTVYDQKAKFMQALNQCINENEKWILQYVVKAPFSGKVTYAGILQQNENVSLNQELFIINPGNTDFFGEIQIPQYNMGNVKLGQRVLIKLKSYPYEQFGMIKGTLSKVSDVAYKDSVFLAKVNFEQFDKEKSQRRIVLKNGMQAEAEIITEESSLFKRFFRNVTKMMNNY